MRGIFSLGLAEVLTEATKGFGDGAHRLWVSYLIYERLCNGYGELFMPRPR